MGKAIKYGLLGLLCGSLAYLVFSILLSWKLGTGEFYFTIPALVNEFIVLIKETSIIGYIGMMDLTKGAMLIQSRTYNAFWPLMAAAAIYLVIVGILTWGMNKLERRLRTSER